MTMSPEGIRQPIAVRAYPVILDTEGYQEERQLAGWGDASPCSLASVRPLTRVLTSWEYRVDFAAPRRIVAITRTGRLGGARVQVKQLPCCSIAAGVFQHVSGITASGTGFTQEVSNQELSNAYVSCHAGGNPPCQ